MLMSSAVRMEMNEIKPSIKAVCEPPSTKISGWLLASFMIFMPNSNFGVRKK